MNKAVAITLPVWKDPQNFVLVEHVRDEAKVYFRCRDEAGNELDEVGCLFFEGVWLLSSERFLENRGYPDVVDTELRSYYLRVEGSELLRALIEKRT